MADVKLLPCRCGGKPVLYENAEHWFRVACPECASSTIWRSRENAIAKWNAGNAPAPVEPTSTSPGVTAGASNAELIAKLREHATDWDGRQMPDLEPAKGDPTAGTLRESAARIASLSAQVESLAWEIDNPETGWCVRVERAEDDAWRKNEAVFSFYMRQFLELADAQRRRAEAAESDARKMREALEPFAKIAGKTGTIDAGSLDAMMFRARAALKETDQ